MKKPDTINHYLHSYGADAQWHLVAERTDNISQVVVIPAYAEKGLLFSTLASLAGNDQTLLDETLVLCVVNNKQSSPEEVKNNNHETINCLELLQKKQDLTETKENAALAEEMRVIRDAKIKIGYIDACSGGLEIPENVGGVGMARKIGMDMALRILDGEEGGRQLIISLDADTLVEKNYLSAIKDYFQRRIDVAVIAYEHQLPEKPAEKEAITCYEIFLRYWVLGLKYANSPYAFHSIGSTIVCTRDAYLAVRGMNRREAAEDFYFLNKLAKTGKVGYIKNTCVHPSVRISSRVPFGTGKRMQRHLSGERDEYLLYDPAIFEILKQWLNFIAKNNVFDPDMLLKKAKEIHPELETYLIHCNMPETLSKICMNTRNEAIIRRQFHEWFDGFRTLKLINYLTGRGFPLINLFTATHRILSMIISSNDGGLALKYHKEENQQQILKHLQMLT